MGEYSIPHLRQAGRISIPEDSFDRIGEARDLHKEGLGTEFVRRQLREGSAPDSGELDRRLDTLHRTVEDLRNDVGLLSEEYDTRARRLVGNFPQAFTHLALVNCALALSNGDT